MPRNAAWDGSFRTIQQLRNCTRSSLLHGNFQDTITIVQPAKRDSLTDTFRIHVSDLFVLVSLAKCLQMNII